MQGRRKKQHDSAGAPATAGPSTPEVRAPQQASGPQDANEPSDSVGDSLAGAGAARPTGAAPSRLKLLFSIRNWRIRTRITALLLLPVVVAALLGGLRIQSSIDKTREMDTVQKAAAIIDQASTLATWLEQERDLLAQASVAPSSDLTAEVNKAKKTTDDQVTVYNAAVAKMNTDSMPVLGATLKDIGHSLTELNRTRQDAFRTSTRSTVDAYNKMILQLLQINQEAPEVTRDPDLIQGARALGSFGESKAYASAQRAAVIAYGLKPNEIPLEASETLARLNESEQNAIRGFTSVAPSDWNTVYKASVSRDKITAVEERFQLFKSMVNAALASNNKPNGLARLENANDFTTQEWWTLSTDKISALGQVEAQLGLKLTATSKDLRDEARTDALINTILVVGALLITILLGVIVARSLVRSLNTLRRSALEVAEERLPETVRRLSESDPGDVDLAIEPIGVLSRDEIGQVARAFDAVHAEAVRLAAEQALLRGNVNAMFVNLSRRSQSLIQRQLALISDLENREADPDQLANLFKLDHLATRMRRNGENLLVLAGEEPGRRWTRPVPLVDVLRAAASEVEQYERVELGALPTTDIAGRAVNDLVHLLAELLENSTTFSSPHTKVRVTGHILPDGRALIEIHDNGIGLTGDDLADANQRLARPPVVDVSISRRMGLFVVGRLATRHGIRVQLRPGEGGGTTALVMLPIELIQGDRPGGGDGWSKGGDKTAAAVSGWTEELPAAAPPAQALPGPRVGSRAQERNRRRELPQRGAEAPAQPVNQAPQPNHAPDHRNNQNAGNQPAQAPVQQEPSYGSTQSFAAPSFQDGSAGTDTPYPGTVNPFASEPGVTSTGAHRAPSSPPPATPGRDDNPFAPVLPQPPQHQPHADDPRTGAFPAAPSAPMFGTGDDGREAESRRTRYGQDTGAFPAAPQPVDELGRAGDTSQFASPFGAPYADEPRPGAEIDRGGYEQPAQPFGRPGAELAPRQDERAPAPWGTEYDELTPVAPLPVEPVAPPAEVPTGYDTPRREELTRREELPQRGRTPRDGEQPPTGDSLPVLRGLAPQARPEPARQERDEHTRAEQVRGPQGDVRPAASPFAPVGSDRSEGSPFAPVGAPENAEQLPAPSELDMSAPPSTGDDGRLPIFDTLESDWFHRQGNRGGRMRAAQVRSTPRGEEQAAPAREQAAEPSPLGDLDRRVPMATNPPQAPAPVEQAPAFGGGRQQPVTDMFGTPTEPDEFVEQSPAVAPAVGPQGQQSGWYSAGDDGWRAAEAAREPSSGGTTGAGLPRRVPRANLVPGGVEQSGGAQAPGHPGAGPAAPGTRQEQSGRPTPGAPGLSRSPDEVRGRLTNFRRGIQQGRTAGSGGSAPRPRDENNQEQA
ncbi:sensor histidine kinase [Embleya scabrispora]|uniref:sensor histidine kinase n=1 Tax=Embleya scabrispora TaxID=159449 RepID=UPI00068DBF69|nr:nitrate- and nitrite sensing domain-containing protein [Embleya scabrispora]MYS82248.1 HAMP domain-containing protein [Streptomyces sp. SID5474]